jgi:soluble lytic murein transglycosylase
MVSIRYFLTTAAPSRLAASRLRGQASGLARAAALLMLAGWTLALPLLPGAAIAQTQAKTQLQTQAQTPDDSVLQAREALRKRDKAALALAKQAVNAANHPLAQWVEQWELQNRLSEVQQSEFDAFSARWPGTYVEDRLRNDWLLELGRRRDWVNFRTELPRFRMNDDREVQCYALLTQHLNGKDVHDTARSAWTAMRNADDGCALLGRTLVEAGAFSQDDVWPALRSAVEMGRPGAARAAAALLGPGVAQATAEILEAPARYLARRPVMQGGGDSTQQSLIVLALMRMANSDPDATATELDVMRNPRLPPAALATAWAHVGKQAALKHLPSAADHARRAWVLWDAVPNVVPNVAPNAAPNAASNATPNAATKSPDWGDELLAWHVRAALRQPDTDKQRWPLVSRAISNMSVAEQRDSAWVYWHARAQLAQAPPGAEGDAARGVARNALESIAAQLGFYGALAAEELGQRVSLPAAPTATTAAERDAVRGRAGLVRALQLINIGLRNEGVREWNYSLRGMGDRELLAAAQWACEREVYDRCINTSERTRTEVDVLQRYPTPFRTQLLAQAANNGVEPALLYGLIRQESRFVGDTRSAVGAFGLMQLMPATAKWTAKKVGLSYQPHMLGDRDVNLQLGSAYLKRLIDDFGGSLTMATAAYNAGPNRPRRWRESGTMLEPAAWAESIPFNETRDYVKKVLSNSVHYAALLAAPLTGAVAVAAPGAAGAARPTLKSRLGAAIGPALMVRDGTSTAPDRDLP